MAENLEDAEQLADDLLSQIDSLLIGADRATKPLELDPLRSRLFELFVTADAARLTAEGSEPDLTTDGIARSLSLRWGLAAAAQESFQQQEKLPPEQLSKMRVLWSFMRMWMEWTYAWSRWDEFHTDG